jgi:hypothetical protein
LADELELATERLEQEMQASFGVFPALVYGLDEAPTLPTAEAALDRNLLILMGALAGLVIGLWAVNLSAAKRGRRGLS